MLTNLKNTIFHKNKEKMTHIGQYHVWKRSIKFRFYLEAIYTFIMTILFQYFVSDFNKRLHIGTDDLIEMDKLKEAGEDYSEVKASLLADIEIMMRDFNVIFYLTVPYILFPVHLLMRMYFEIRTKRFDSAKFTPIHWCEAGCFIILVLWELEKRKFMTESEYDLDMGEGYTPDQHMIVDIIRSVRDYMIYFQFLLSALVTFTWVKLLLMFRVSKQFGPLFKMIHQMTIELGKFLVFWFTMILIFACIAMLVFSHISQFHDLWDSFIYFLSAALGNYDLTIFKISVDAGYTNDVREINALALNEFGIIFMIIYLFVNMILMLNMVIAILA